MLLMIWVNDFWSLKDIPKWLQHANYGEDYLGFSDVIFPLFLFLVGLELLFLDTFGATNVFDTFELSQLGQLISLLFFWLLNDLVSSNQPSKGYSHSKHTRLKTITTIILYYFLFQY